MDYDGCGSANCWKVSCHSLRKNEMHSACQDWYVGILNFYFSQPNLVRMLTLWWKAFLISGNWESGATVHIYYFESEHLISISNWFVLKICHFSWLFVPLVEFCAWIFISDTDSLQAVGNSQFLVSCGVRTRVAHCLYQPQLNPCPDSQHGLALTYCCTHKSIQTFR